MLHEAPVPKERNEGSEEHAQPLSLVALPYPKFKNGSKFVVELRAAGNWLPKIVVASELQLAHGVNELAVLFRAAPLLDVIPNVVARTHGRLSW